MKTKISQSELDVMDVLWRRPGIAASDVVRDLSGTKDWSDRTIKTLLARLVDKGVLATEKEGRRFLYTPIVSRDAYAGPAARRLAQRLFGGRAAPIVAHLAEGEGLSDEDIAELEALIESLKS